MPKWFNSTTRLWLYGVVVAVLAVAVAYKWVAPEQVPLWTSLAAQILGTATIATAGAALVAQRRTGDVEAVKPKPRKAVKRPAPVKPPARPQD